jgi:trk system potassium uptake protein TrkH
MTVSSTAFTRTRRPKRTPKPHLEVSLTRHLSPERIFILSFAAVIVAGAVLLSFPVSASKEPLPWVDALFQSASAVCVTGLATIDIGRDLSRAGQVVLIALFQVGGLGILTFSTIFFMLLGRSLASKEQDIMQSAFLYAPRRDLRSILVFVVFSTLLYESAGTAVLWVRFSRDFPGGEALYLAAFHSISAFNNCGFSLFSDNLVRYQGDPTVNLVIMGLIVAGGLGFIVHYELHMRIFGNQRRLSVHTRLVLIVTAILIASGALLFYVFEQHAILRGLPLQTQVLASLFQSITPRTAGFNTVDIGLLTNETILMMIILMFVGASPGSTGGGIKTTSAGILFLLMWNRLKGREDVHVFNRTIPRELLNRTLSIILMSTLCIFVVVSVLLLSAASGRAPTESRHLFVEYLFETVSAFGTVGLSMNLTPGLSPFQKLAIVLMMFAGRVGPLTLAFSLARSASKRSYTYAEEGVMVG